MIAVVALLIIRCALTLAVLGVLVLPFALSSRLSLAIDVLGITCSLGLLVLASFALRWGARRASPRTRRPGCPREPASIRNAAVAQAPREEVTP